MLLTLLKSSAHPFFTFAFLFFFNLLSSLLQAQPFSDCKTVINGQSFKNWDISVPTARCNYIRHDWMKSNIYACLLVCLDFCHKFGRPVIVKVNRTIRGAWSKLLPIQAEIAFDRKSRDTMVLIPFVLVKLKRGTWREDCNIIPIWLSNKKWIKWVAPYTRTGVGFHINLKEKEEAFIKYLINE